MSHICCSRRIFLNGALSTIFAGTYCGEPCGAELPITCSWTMGDLTQTKTYSKSKTPELDRALIVELKKIITVIPVNPGFQFIEDDSPNAFATSQTKVPGTKGTVLIGFKLLAKLMEERGGGISVAGVCAHECGHIYQFFSQFSDHFAKSANGLMMQELHADFIAGYYMGKRSELAANSVKSFEKTLVDWGSFDFANPKYHGAPAQRAFVMEMGYVAARNGTDFQKAAEQGEAFVKMITAPFGENL